MMSPEDAERDRLAIGAQMEKMKASRSLRIVESVMGHTKWFMCFGNLLHLIRDGTIEFDKDIDIGVFYEKADAVQIVRGFRQWSYDIDIQVNHDGDKKPLYIAFKYRGPEGFPPIDVFFWILADKIRYHTYDAFQEKKTIPSKYLFKGVRAKYLPNPEGMAKDDPKVLRTFFGKWNDPYFQHEVQIPLWYGSLLDTWYPNWLKPVRMESVSPYTVELSKCSQLGNKDLMAPKLAESLVRYRAKQRELM